MTTATLTRSTELTQTRPVISYQVAMSEPTSHLFEVTLQIRGWNSDRLDLKMAVWTPGSYLVREYSRHVQDFSAKANQQKLVYCKCAKNHWQVETPNHSEITVTYRVFANELTVRTNHLDATHGYFNGAALFLYVPQFLKQSYTVTIIPPDENWQVTTSLPLVEGKENTFIAKDFDTLVDSPFEVGIHQKYDFEVLGIPHQLAIWGQGNVNVERLISDTQKIIATEAKMFGGLPYDRYVFLLHLSKNSYGGLEHKKSCTLIYSRFGFRAKDKYNNFIQLVAHEFFHLWNVKRIRPKALEIFDYEQENYTNALWFCEGVTSYYDIVFPMRSGIYDSKTFVDLLGKEINRYLSIPGRKVQPVSESSFDAWIKLYRRDANSDNSQISYYLKGQLIAMLLDLLIRQRHDNQRSFDDVMRIMWEKYGKAEIGYTDAELKKVIESVAKIDLSDFFTRFIDGVEELPFEEYLEPFGLELKKVYEEERVPYLGIKVNSENGKEIIKFVEIGSPGQIAGINTEDELLALDGFRVSGDQISDRLKDYQENDIIQVTVFHQDELRTLSVKLAAPQPSRYELVRIQNSSDSQKQNFSEWVRQAINP
ncbi:M61 family metallopeptidase [Chroococcus sp. FPU101]|uniref:M61 family metallopeptidase n=1 Tax=Chroococcus sp. FPU101 TaxID=1974212 RepID=UPI001A8BFD5B|nr:M61 family metallopeptidase [Chroococcus sp. FPU101]GFE67669.1 peptidase M61 domain protein [Chroococcus sp. FPU101]